MRDQQKESRTWQREAESLRDLLDRGLPPTPSLDDPRFCDRVAAIITRAVGARNDS
jgi:hypothetical protein